MAKKAKSPKRARHYPVARQIRVLDPSVVATTTRRIEADRILSEVNRRMYRQSRVYSMKVDLDINSELAAGGIDVWCLYDTWDLHGAYKLAMKAFYNAMKEEIKQGGGQVGRWMDFKVSSGVTSDLLWPYGGTSTLSADRLDNGEHEYSTVVDTDGSATRIFSLKSGPTNASEWSVLNEWDNKDAVDPDPAEANIQAGTPYNNLTAGMDDANMDLLQSQYNHPPYNDQVHTSPWRKIGTLQVGASGNMKLTTGFFDAPLGIVIITGVSGDAGDKGISVSFQSGDYKGVKAAPYATPMLTGSEEYEVV